MSDGKQKKEFSIKPTSINIDLKDQSSSSTKNVQKNGEGSESILDKLKRRRAEEARLASGSTTQEEKSQPQTKKLDLSSEKPGILDKMDDSFTTSPTKSILKRGSLKEGDTSPDRKKKGVAFLAALEQETTIIRAPEKLSSEEEQMDDDEESKFDDSLFQQTRQRSISTEGHKHLNSLMGNKSIGLSGFNNDVPKNVIIRNVSVGKVQDGMAILLSEDFNVIEVPLSMLPTDVRKGNILKFTVERNIIEEEGRKENITRMQREILSDKDLFNDYNKKLDYFKARKMEILQNPSKGNIDLQNVIDAVHDNLQETSFLDRSEIVYNDRVIVRQKSPIARVDSVVVPQKSNNVVPKFPGAPLKK